MNASTHERCAQALVHGLDKLHQLSAFAGFDGFIDEIIHVVDKREDAQQYTRLPSIASFAARIASASSKSTNIELVTQRTKLGGNGPIMAHALAQFGLRVTYVGNLGYPAIHPVFSPLAEKAEVHSIAGACHTDALEFNDGKLLLGKTTQLNEITWPNIQTRFGRDKFAAKFNTAQLVAFLNWTMVPCMSEIWEALLKELCPILTGGRRLLFFDLADPAKRSANDLRHALDLISRFEQCFDVILGLNEKEAYEISSVLGINGSTSTPEALADLGREIRARVPVHTIAIHPITYALAVSEDTVSTAAGPHIPSPVITTGAGDHFNAGFCLGKLLGLDNELSLLTGVSTSGFYVRTGLTPTVLDLVELLRNWPTREDSETAS